MAVTTFKSREGIETINAEMRRLSPRVTGGILKLRQDTYFQGNVPSKYKLLTAMAISVAIRCEPCIRAYVEWAVKEGASKEEMIEFLNVAMAMQGCPGEEWSLKALKAYKEFFEEGTVSTDTNESCCVVPH